MKYTLIAVGVLALGMIGCGSGSNTSSGSSIPAQSCAANWTWNEALRTCVQNTQFPQNNFPAQTNVPVTTTAGATVPAQVYSNNPVTPSTNMQCPQGQYFNGTICAAVVVQQGDCQYLNTQGYGCVTPSNDCQHQYSYFEDNGDCNCMPVPVYEPQTGSQCGGHMVRVRNRHGRIVMRSTGGCVDGVQTPRKVVIRKNGKVKIKW